MTRDTPDAGPAGTRGDADSESGLWARIEGPRPWIALLALALAMRAAAAAGSVLVHNDSVLYMEIARSFSEGRWAEGFGHYCPPLPSLLIAIARVFLPSLESAGFAVCVLASSLAVIPLHLVARDAFGRRAAFLAGIAYAAIPAFVSFGSNVLSEGPYFLFFMLAVWTFHSALAGRARLGAAAGASAACANLCRPEGAGLLAVFLLWTAFATASDRPRMLKSRAIALALAAASFCALSAPYVLHIRSETGRWDFTMKKKMAVVLGAGDAAARGESEGADVGAPAAGKTPEPRVARAAKALIEVANTSVEVLFYLPPVFALAGLLVVPGRGGRRRGKAYLASIIAFYAAVCWAFLFTNGYLSGRHVSAAMICATPFAGAGLSLLADLAARAHGRMRNREPSPSAAGFAAVAIALLFAAACMPKALKPFGADKTHVRESGLLLRTLCGPGQRIMSSEMRVPHYADGIYVPLSGPDGIETLHRAALDKDCTILVAGFGSEPFLANFPRAAAALRNGKAPGFQKIFEFRHARDAEPVAAFRVLPQKGSSLRLTQLLR